MQMIEHHMIPIVHAASAMQGIHNNKRLRNYIVQHSYNQIMALSIHGTAMPQTAVAKQYRATAY
jgi:hypothetical protein